MTRAMKELRDVAAADVPKRIQDLRKEYAKLQAQVSTGTPPKNTMQLKNIRRTISRLLTITSSKGKQMESSPASPPKKGEQLKKQNQQKMMPKKKASNEVNPKA
ncbi:50S ribosomal protein L29 [Candidatus Woesearchaeota archaeon]|nr:50S ribosomal protein L29 [Candidatus Woesearchaeota archaeon]